MANSLEESLALPSPLVEVVDERLAGTRLLLKRDDLIHPEIPGNKWRKLKYLLADARTAATRTLLTFGGAHSNHVRAVAAVGHSMGFETIGVIRGEEEPFNPGLGQAVADGMRLHYLSRAQYRRKAEPEVIEELRRKFGDFYLVPEGGTTSFVFPGCAELIEEIDTEFDVIVCAVGTGGTLAGIAGSVGTGCRVLGISALKGAYSLSADVDRLHRSAFGRPLHNWTIDHGFHLGGFARRPPELDRFIEEFEARHEIRLEQVYVAKMMFGIYRLVADGRFSGETVVAVVSGACDPATASAAPGATRRG